MDRLLVEYIGMRAGSGEINRIFRQCDKQEASQIQDAIPEKLSILL